jgi:phosphoserine phosphatase RsbU/P
MPEAQPSAQASGQTILEVISPDRSRRIMPITESPFLIGRGGESGNHVQLQDRRISRQCAAIVSQSNGYTIEDKGQRWGIFVNGERIQSCTLRDADVITFGLEDSYQIIFRSSAADSSLQSLLSRIPTTDATGSAPGGLQKLSLLLEATMLLHSHLPLDAVLGTMLDHTIAVTNADRGVLVEPDSKGALKVRLARGKGGTPLPPTAVTPSQTALRLATDRKTAVITEDIAVGHADFQAAQSIVAQSLRAVVAIPLYALPHSDSNESLVPSSRGFFLGVVYLDSQRPAAFSRLERQILDALGVEAASILDNARLVQSERERQRLEQELNIARGIQQALLPARVQDFPHLLVAGINLPCLAVGGDYFDVFPISEQLTGFLIADVSGKGLGAALLTTMLQGAFSAIGAGVNVAHIFNQVNRFLCTHQEVERYATLFFGVVDRDGNLEFINAGHPSPLLLRRGEIVEPFTERSFPVGLIPDAAYASSPVKLEAGDTLVLFSDGVTEAANPGEELYGVPRLREVLCAQCNMNLDKIQKVVLDSVENFARGTSQADDITLLLLRYRPSIQ